MNDDQVLRNAEKRRQEIQQKLKAVDTFVETYHRLREANVDVAEVETFLGMYREFSAGAPDAEGAVRPAAPPPAGEEGAWETYGEEQHRSWTPPNFSSSV